MKAIAAVLTLALVVCGSTFAHAQSASDFELMMTWLAGQFDNNQQVLDDKQRKVQRPHEHLRAVVAPVQLPAPGSRVFYVQQHSPGDPATLARQRLYSFTLDTARATITQRWYAIPDGKAVLDAHLDPGKLAGLAPDRLRTTPGCELYWTRQGDAFVGQMKPGACRSTSRSTGKAIIVSAAYRLTADALWMSERIEEESGAVLSEPPDGVPFKLLRVR